MLSWIVRWIVLVIFVGILALIVADSLGLALPRQDEGWIIERLDASVVIEPDGALRIAEAIDVDFRELERHGIFRDIPVLYRHTATTARVYALSVLSVTNAAGAPWRYEAFPSGPNVRIKIGDPARTVSGRQAYRIAYRVRGALNAFADHDELYWNVNGAAWPVPARQVSARVVTPTGALDRATCFQGGSGSTEACRLGTSAERIDYAATRGLAPGEQLTVVAALRKGAVAVPPPSIVPRDRDIVDLFEVNPATLSLAGLLLLGGLLAVGSNLWYEGRDREYVSRYYLRQDPTERIRPLLAYEPLVAEYEPPEKLRPAQVGLLLDERADPKDLTATIVDLAVRGHLAIEEIPIANVLGHQIRDWRFARKRADTGELRPYEKILFGGLFAGGRESVRVSELAGKFHDTLEDGQRALYEDAVGQRWFGADPDRVRARWLSFGCLALVGGAILAVALGFLAGVGLVGLAVLALGVVLIIVGRAMPRRTAAGRELLRHILGFRLYMETAETERQRFAERENLFIEYLPYAIVFGSVTKWARAFAGLDVAKAAASWYTGATALDTNAFSSGLQSFSSSVSSAIVSTPGGSGGGSGFSGGGAGGGGGGGGGGSW